jgi:N-acetylmuramoyl-L-alanine amidase
MKRLTIYLDPGHGMSNRKPWVYDSGASVRVNGKDITEAEIVMDWADELRALLMAAGHKVVRSRINANDPAPIGERVEIAREYKADVLISLHCNAADGKAHGTETFYRSASNKKLALACNKAITDSLGTKDRGVKLESLSQHKSLAVLAFPRAVLIELAFIDHAQDRLKLTDEKLRLLACGALADAITSSL